MAQRFCAMTEYSWLGSGRTPLNVMMEGKPVFVCCKGCVKGAAKGGKDTLAKAEILTKASVVLAKLSAEDRAAAEAQKYCAMEQISEKRGNCNSVPFRPFAHRLIMRCLLCTKVTGADQTTLQGCPE